MTNTPTWLVSRRGLVVGIIAAIAPATAPAVERDVQFASIDFVSEVIELHNFGPTDQTLTRWQFCTHSDDNGEFRYTSTTALNSVTVETGTSLFIWLNNDGPGGADNLNVNQISGSFATTMDQDAYSIGLYWPQDGSVGFADAGDLVDHIQWNIGGVDNTQADGRSFTAQQSGLWSDQNAWISTTAATMRLELILDEFGQPVGEPHGPASYRVVEPQLFEADFDGDGDVDGDDLDEWESRFGDDLDGANLLAWQREFGSGAAAVAEVPEPSGALLLFFSSLAGGMMRPALRKRL